MTVKNRKNKNRLVFNVLQEKCPNCSVGAAFLKNRGMFSFPKMHDECQHCQYHFEREPGFFIGAMYISYGLAVFQGTVAFILVNYFVSTMEPIWEVVIVILTILLFSRKNFKWSRILYIHIFPW
jgi:uncharacterized protein (DUF983 family)